MAQKYLINFDLVDFFGISEDKQYTAVFMTSNNSRGTVMDAFYIPIFYAKKLISSGFKDTEHNLELVAYREIEPKIVKVRGRKTIESFVVEKVTNQSEIIAIVNSFLEGYQAPKENKQS